MRTTLSVVCVCTLAMLLTSIDAGAQSASQAVLDSTLRKYSFTPLKPPVLANASGANALVWRPGYVFTIERFQGGNQGASSICYGVFGNNVVDQQWVHPETNLERDVSVGLAAKLLSGVGRINAAYAGIDASWVASTKLVFDELTQLSPVYGLSDSEKSKLAEGLAAETEVLDLSRDCAQRIRTALSDGKKVYVVVNSLQATGITLEIDRSRGNYVNAGLSLNDVVDIEAGAQVASRTAERITLRGLSSPVLLGTQVALIRRARRDTAVSAGPTGTEKIELEIQGVPADEDFNTDGDDAGDPADPAL